jgi:DNA-directed RNA polymerase III subunit RPC8
MFGIHYITDSITIPASHLQYHSKSKSLLPILHREIDRLYPNRVLIDIGLVISRYYTVNDTTTTINRRRHHHHHSMNENVDSSPTATGTVPTVDVVNHKRKRIHFEAGSSSSLSHNNNDNDQCTTTRRTSTAHTKRTTTTTQVLHNGSGSCHSNGTVQYTVRFPLLLFRPYVQEILIGTILDMNAHGMVVTMGNFFAAIYIPTMYMLHPSIFVPSTTERTTTKKLNTTDGTTATGIWVWTPTYDDEEEKNPNDTTGTVAVVEPIRYEMHIGDEVRVRVKSVHYTQTEERMSNHNNTGNNNTLHGKPTGVSTSTTATTTIGNHNNNNNNNNNQSNPNPTNTGMKQQQCAMYIIASICEDGLGLTTWWKNENDEEEEEEEEVVDDNVEDDEYIVEEMTE